MRLIRFAVPAVLLFGLAAPSLAGAAGSDPSSVTAPPASTPIGNGGAGVGAPSSPSSTPDHPVIPGIKAKIIKGVAYAPAYAPPQVQRAIWAGNQIRKKPYVYGGGHGVWKDFGYDCSGTVSFVLHAAGLLKTSMDSTGFESWGRSGSGHWITVYTNPAHAFVQIAGIRLDTSREGDPNPAPGTGPRWRPVMHGPSSFQSRHPSNL